MKNKPSGNAGQITIGPGRIYIGPTGATPTFDVGYVRGEATLTFMRERVEIRQGSPQVLIKAMAAKEDATLEFNGIEWDMDALAKALGDGTTSLSGASEILKFGGAPDFNEYALQFVHQMADGGTLTVNMWRVVPGGEVAAAINPEEEHELPMKFDAMDNNGVDWGGNSLANGQQLVMVERITP